MYSFALETIPGRLIPNVMLKWLTLLLCIWEISGSILSLDTIFLTEVFRGFPQFLQANAGIVP
jgi:hypothetical protein